MRYARQVKLDYPLLIGEQDGLEAAQAFGLDMGFPFTIFADHKRRVIAVKIGELHRNEAEFILDQIAGINAGSLQVENSRKAIAAALRQFAVEREQKTGKAAVKGTATTS